jgi:broad specificity phosphatase PhoE
LKHITLIRHGQSTFNAAYELTGRDPGFVDARLSELGEQQATQTGIALKDFHVDLVVASPLTRAIQTANFIFRGRNLPTYVTCRHRERVESTADVGRSPALLAEEFPHFDFDHLDDPWWHHDPASVGPFAVEPVETFQQRVEHFKDWLRGHEAQRIAVVGHATFFSAMTGHWMQNCEVFQWQGE